MVIFSQDRTSCPKLIWLRFVFLVFNAISIEIFSNDNSFPANVIGNDPYSDIALLKIQANGKNDSISLNPIEIGDSENLKAGQFVLALANPYGEYPSITEGIITSERSSLGGGRW